METKRYDAVLIGSGSGKKAIQAVLNQDPNPTFRAGCLRVDSGNSPGNGKPGWDE